MKNNYDISFKKRNKILNTFLSGYAVRIASDYLDFLEQNNNAPEIILNFLDQSIFLIKKDIKIEKMNRKITFIENDVEQEIDKFLLEETEYKKLYKRLNFLFAVIKTEKLQREVFSYLYNNFLEYKKIKKISEKKAIKNNKSNYIENIIKKLIKNNNQNFKYNWK